MKQLFIAFIIVLTYILQTTLMPEITVFGVHPDLCLIIICSIAFLFGSTSGGVVGFFLGIMTDLYYGRSIGINALLFLYIGILLGSLNKRVFKDNYLVILIFLVFTTFIYESIAYFYVAFVYSQSVNMLIALKNIGVVILLNSIISFFVYPILLKINIDLEIDRNIFSKR